MQRRGDRLRPQVAGVLALVIALAGSGCGRSTESVVQGTVTIDGKPVDSGMIRFLSPNGSGPTFGAAIASGRYRAVAAPGSVLVEIQGFRTVREVRPSPDPAAPAVPIIEPLLPSDRSPIKRTLAPGRNTLDFAL